MRARARTYTFVFTDIVDSSGQWETEPARMAEVVEAHNRIVRDVVSAHGGEVFKSLGDGRAAVFESTRDAVRAAVDSQARLSRELDRVLVRVGVHAGSAELIDGDYLGSAVNRVARITALAHGRQVLVSETARILAIDDLGTAVEWKFVGEAVLIGHDRPERLHQVCLPSQSADFPRLPTLAPRNNLTALERPLIGRVAERRDLDARLASESQRLITILGFGGMGKTTLARQCALDSLDVFPDGVWWVECETLESREDIAASAMSAMGLFPDPRSPEGSLTEALAEKRVLLILDCFERIVLRSGLIDSVLKACPRVTILVTSRLRLGLAWEFEFELRGLGRRRGRATTADAVALFQEAAVHVAPEFRVTRRNSRQVAALVRHLDFIPLALVITAGRLRHLTLEEILQSVERSLLDIVSTGKDAEGRHASLRAVIGASLALLPPGLLTALYQLSVFEGGFFLEDARNILGFGDGVLDAVCALRDHSLIHADPSDGGMRFRELDAVREYVGESVPESEFAGLRRAHALNYLTVARRVSALYKAGDWSRAARLLWLESGNLRSAIQYLRQTGGRESLEEYALCLSRPYVENGLITEFESLAALTLRDANGPLLRELLGLKGIVALRGGHRAEAEAFWLERAAVCEQGDDIEGAAEALGDVLNLAIEDANREKVLQVKESYDRVGAAFFGAKRLEHIILKARCESFLGNHETALTLADQVASDVADGDPDDWKFYVSRTLAEIYRNAGRYDMSLAAAGQTLRLGLIGRFAHRVAQALLQVALTYSSEGHAGEALRAASALRLIPNVSDGIVMQITSLEDRLRVNSVREGADGVEGPVDWATASQAVLEQIRPFQATGNNR